MYTLLLILHLLTLTTAIPYKYAGGNLGFWHLDFYSNPDCSEKHVETEWMWAARNDHSEPTCYRFRPEELASKKIQSVKMDRLTNGFTIRLFGNEKCDTKKEYKEIGKPGDCVVLEEGVWSYYVNDS